MKNFLIILLMILIVGGTGYAIYYQVDRFNKESNVTNESKKEEVKEGNKEELDVNSEQVKSLMKKIYVYNYFELQEKTGYFYLKDKYTQNDIEDDIKIYLGLSTLDEVNSDEPGGELKDISIPEDKIRSAVQSVFGKNVKYNNNNVDFNGCIAAIYNSDTKSYTVTPPACGGSVYPYYKTKITSAFKYDNRIEIYEAAIYITPNTENEPNITMNVYKPNKKDIMAEKVTDDNLDIERYIHKTDSYKYTFMLEDGNYYFNSVEKVEG